MRRGLSRLIAAIGIAALAGCSGTEAAITPPPGVPDPVGCGSVNIAVNPWSGYSANVAVVSYLLENELNCTVGTVELSETASWAGLVDGSIDVILENWGHDDLKKKYIDGQKVAVELGLTGNKGVIGWYVPPWMARTYPDITNWRKLNSYADLFKTKASGEKGQFLAGDPSFVTNDDKLIENLKLDYTVVYAGSEDKLIAAFRKAQANRTPLLGYFYEPQWLLSDIKLVRVPLPNYTPGCDADGETVACDYQPYDLDKIARKKFVDSGSPAATFLRNWTWTNDDQNKVAKDMTQNNLSAEDAARRWVDANRTVWEKWLP
ncbi:glycine/betaine-binding protein [Actinoplanes lobatus]|uniref:Glycine betaine/proline transport system substrate-binding protein n=1 Tax=Actinoplanes lobatus TaxID=113568 RepID=A0A7W7HH85_9ACTN|nr:ABC transporter substrate-binding protein [Actinoplanes lobatus]MBB4750477.1 glycine betaine/proline transport system substrate-binding protein [Actinoplanes lobatus]GGN90136.1 glycine/betaine-binding protein [Actinoplanes lobatus]GIE43846.1 glycine/betaine-binding protein [Actinoplanes lobatus]